MPQKKTLDTKFFEYHEANPHIFKLFEKYARQVKSLGHTTYSMRTIMHRVRWHLNVETRDPDGFKMNNNYSSRYSRMLVEFYPEFEGFFKFRKLQTKSVWGN